jgi:hypothetical protein
MIINLGQNNGPEEPPMAEVDITATAPTDSLIITALILAGVVWLYQKDTHAARHRLKRKRMISRSL